jgi:exodeoxyribonuclease III
MNLIGIWAKNDKEDPKRRYIGNVWCALNHYKDLLEAPIIIAGDFNWNVIWDNDKSSLYGTLTDVIDLLKQNDIHTYIIVFLMRYLEQIQILATKKIQRCSC